MEMAGFLFSSCFSPTVCEPIPGQSSSVYQRGLECLRKALLVGSRDRFKKSFIM